jgi:hypothetical protein
MTLKITFLAFKLVLILIFYASNSELGKINIVQQPFCENKELKIRLKGRLPS